MNSFIPLDKPLPVTEQVWPDGTIPIVSVFNWVYNHKEYIRESIESILVQKTTFPIEIIIHDDASNDGTKEIILEYQKKHPQLFRNILHEENQWSQGKSVMTPLTERPRGKYIALTHGDDYWTDPYKLQKQVDFLEANPDYSGCFCNTKYVDSEGNEIGICKRVPDGMVKIGFEEMVQRFMLHTPSFMLLRANVTPDLLETIKKYPAGDLPLVLQCNLNGKIGYLNEVMAAYRINVGVTSNWSNYVGLVNKVNILFGLKQDFKLTQSENRALNWGIAFHSLKLAKNFAQKEKLKSLKYYLLFLKYLPNCFLLKEQKVEQITLKDVFRPLFYLIK